MAKEKTVLFLRIVLGLVFMVSGVAKAVDSGYFASVIASYGIPVLGYVAPVIIGLELLLGLFLFLGMMTRLVSLLSFLTVLFFTLIYSYGLLFVDVSDCGCFGHINILNSSPWFLYLRNAVLAVGFVYLFFVTRDDPRNVSFPILLVSVVFIFAGAFITGKSFKWKPAKTNAAGKVERIALADHELRDFYDFSPDSTYMVTVFSYTCPHCMNSIGNLEQFERFGVVDKVVGISLTDSVNAHKFRELFKPEFQIKSYPARRLFKLTNEFPTSYFISNDTIHRVIQGEIPSAYFFIDTTR